MKVICIFVLFMSISIFSCKKDTSPIISSFTGIVHTDVTGNIIEDDLKDWQPRWIEPGWGNPNIEEGLLYCIPAYPNPTNTTSIISFVVRERANVKITVFISPLNELHVLYDKTGLLGQYQILFDANDLDSGIYRIYIDAKSENYEETSYGDVQVKDR